MQAFLYSFQKRKNSTKIVDAQGTEVQLVLKDKTDIVNPVFFIRSSGYLNYNYAYVPDFGRYYFIKNQRMGINNAMELECEVDALATYKANIVGADAFISYRTKTNTEIVDPRLSMQTSATVQYDFASVPHINITTGTYIIGVQGKDSVDYFCTDNLRHISRLLTSATFDNFIQSLSTTDDILKQILSCGNVAENIKSCIWVPFDVPRSLSSGNVFLGGYDTGYSLPRVDKQFELIALPSISIPWQASDWRRNAPYHQIFVRLPFVGLVPVSPSTVMDSGGIHMQGAINYYSGDITYSLDGDNGAELGLYGASTACPISIGASNINPKDVIGGAIGIGASIAAGAVTGGAGAAVGLGTMSAIKGILNTDMQSGGLYSAGGGTGIASGELIEVITVFHDTNVSPHNLSNISGEPEMSVQPIPGSGYVETVGFSVSGTMVDAERVLINNMLDRGAYIE